MLPDVSPRVLSAPPQAPDDIEPRLRVMQVVLSLSPGGTERLVIEIVRRLAARADMQVCCLEEPGTWVSELIAGVPVMSLAKRPGFHPGLGYRLASIVRASNVDVVHCHHYSPFVYGQLAALLQPGLRVVFTEHGRLSDRGPSPKRRFVNPWLGRLPDQIFAVSAALRRHMIAEGLPGHRIEVVNNGIDPGEATTPFARHRARHVLGIPAADLVIGTIGRLDAVKDIPTMIGALASLRARGAAARLVIVGDGPQAPALASLVKAFGLDESVQFVGYRSDVRSLLAGFDLYANSSIHEGVSLTILEAMAASLPVVATAVGGNPEVVVHGQTGILVPPRNPPALAQAIGALIQATPERRVELGRAGRNRVRQDFNIERMVARYFQSYLDASHGRAKTPRVDTVV